jgi:hypothetical protein
MTFDLEELTGMEGDKQGSWKVVCGVSIQTPPWAVSSQTTLTEPTSRSYTPCI